MPKLTKKLKIQFNNKDEIYILFSSWEKDFKNKNIK